MASFGQLLRLHRRQCRDPLRGGPLTQERLGELLGEALGHAGYSGAAVSEWERNKSKIDEDNRAVLVGLIGTLQRYGGLDSAAEADALLHAGNYRALDAAELTHLFPGYKRELSPQRPLKPDAATHDDQEIGSSRRPVSRSISTSSRATLAKVAIAWTALYLLL